MALEDYLVSLLVTTLKTDKELKLLVCRVVEKN